MKNTVALLSNALLTVLLSTSAVFAAETFSVKAFQEKAAGKKTDQTAIEKIERQYLRREETPERKALAKARELFVKNKFNEAIAQYDLIPRGSDSWLEAVEEKGWAYHRLGDFEKALAQTKTLLSDPLVQVVGSEPFFLQSLSQLKICDYASILNTHKLYKESQRSRVESLEALAKTGQNDAVNSLIEKGDQFPLAFSEVGVEAKSLPRLFYRDLKLQKSLLELKLAPSAKQSAEARLQLQNRIKALAAIEVEQNKKMLQKLSLIEVETIQRLHADKDLDKNSFHQGEFAQTTDDDLVFPDDGRPWLDELDKYQVKANACPQNIRRKM